MLSGLNTSTSCDCAWTKPCMHTNTQTQPNIRKHTHTHSDRVCVIVKPKYPWLLRWSGTAPAKLQIITAPRLQKKQTTTVGIKVCMSVCVSYLQHSAFCSLRIFMAVRYAENLTLFRSATGRDRDTEMNVLAEKKTKTVAENQKTKCNRNMPTGQHKQDLCLQ